MSAQMNRRTALMLLGAGVVSSRLQAAETHLHALRTQPDKYKLQFFSPEEYRLIDDVAEMIIPADDHSPGAREAKVGYYIDLVVANSSEQTKGNWKSRLSAFEELAQAEQGKSFMTLDPGQRERILNLAAQHERTPETPAEYFFADMKRMTVFAYYSSEIGLDLELEYQGNRWLHSFPGCTHDPSVHK